MQRQGARRDRAQMARACIDCDRGIVSPWATPQALDTLAPATGLPSRVQYGAEAHIVTLIAKGEKPEGGCDDYWDGKAAVYEKCAAMFGILYKLGDTSAPYLDEFIAKVPLVAGKEADIGIESFDLEKLLPAHWRHYTYVGSLVRTRAPPVAMAT
jgi:Eukaryotic-type carbonic anhydrase